MVLLVTTELRIWNIFEINCWAAKLLQSGQQSEFSIVVPLYSGKHWTRVFFGAKSWEAIFMKECVEYFMSEFESLILSYMLQLMLLTSLPSKPFATRFPIATALFIDTRKTRWGR
jgi:hypothetical protein